MRKKNIKDSLPQKCDKKISGRLLIEGIIDRQNNHCYRKMNKSIDTCQIRVLKVTCKICGGRLLLALTVEAKAEFCEHENYKYEP